MLYDWGNVIGRLKCVETIANGILSKARGNKGRNRKNREKVESLLTIYCIKTLTDIIIVQFLIIFGVNVYIRYRYRNCSTKNTLRIDTKVCVDFLVFHYTMCCCNDPPLGELDEK